MGWLMERIRPDGRPAYTAMYRDLRGRKRSAGTFTSEREANRAWQRAEAALGSGRRIADPRRGRQTVRAYVEDEWFPNHVIEATTRESYRYILDRYLLPALGDLRMADVLPNEVRRHAGGGHASADEGSGVSTAGRWIGVRLRHLTRDGRSSPAPNPDHLGDDSGDDERRR